MNLMKSFSRYFSFIVLPVLIGISVGCNRRAANAVDTTLDAIESIVISRPDSALQVLNRLDSLLTTGEAKLQGEEQNARYALLKSQTYDKNWIDLTSDSLIRIAFDYYTQHGSDQERMKSWFYLAAIQRNSEDYSSAYFSYLEAERLCRQLEDYYYLRRIYSNLSEICYDTYSKDAIKYGDLCYEAAQKGNDQFGIQLAYAYKGMAYRLLNQKDSAEFYFWKVVEGLPNSNIIIQNCLSDFAELCVVQKRYELADSLLHLKSIFKSGDYGNLACLHAWAGRQDSADYYLSLAEKTRDEQGQQVFLYEKQYLVALFRNDYKTALEYKNKRINLQDKMVSDIYRKSVADYQRNYELQQKEFATYRYKQQKRWTITIISLSAIVVLAIIAYLLSLIRKRKRLFMQAVKKAAQNEFVAAQQRETVVALKKDITAMHEERNRLETKLAVMAESLSEKESAEAATTKEMIEAIREKTALEKKIADMECQLSEQLATGSRLTSQLESLFATRFKMFDRVGTLLFTEQGKIGYGKQVALYMQEEIKRISKDESLMKEIDSIIDSCYGGVMGIAKSQELHLSETDIETIRLTMMNLSAKSAAYILDKDNVLSLYKRKERLKKKLLEDGGKSALFIYEKLAMGANTKKSTYLNGKIQDV